MLVLVFAQVRDYNEHGACNIELVLMMEKRVPQFGQYLIKLISLIIDIHPILHFEIELIPMVVIKFDLNPIRLLGFNFRQGVFLECRIFAISAHSVYE